MANIKELLRLFHYLMFIVKFGGLRGFFYDNAKQKYRMFYMGDKKWQSYYSWLMHIIIFLCPFVYIFLRIRFEWQNNNLNKLENGVCHKAEFAMAYLQCIAIVLMLLCFINFKRNQKNFMITANHLLFIHSIVKSLRKSAIKCCGTLIMLAYLLLAQIIGKYLILIYVQTTLYKIADSYQSYLLFIHVFCIGVEFLCDFHFLLLLLCFTLLSSYYRHFNDFLLKKNQSRKYALKHLQQIILLLPKLQTVEHFMLSYFCLQFILRFLLLLRAFYSFVATFKYDAGTLHPFVGADEDDESSADMYHEPRIARHNVVYANSLYFVFHVLDLIGTLIAAHALRVEKLEFQQNLLNLVNFSLYFPKKNRNATANGTVSEQEALQLQADPNAIIESNLHCDISYQSYILDVLFELDFKIEKLKSNAEVFLLQCQLFKVPLKQITATCKLIVYSAFVLLIFDTLQISEIENLEKLSAKGQIDG